MNHGFYYLQQAVLVTRGCLGRNPRRLSWGVVDDREKEPQNERRKHDHEGLQRGEEADGVCAP